MVTSILSDPSNNPDWLRVPARAPNARRSHDPRQRQILVPLTDPLQAMVPVRQARSQRAIRTVVSRSILPFPILPFLIRRLHAPGLPRWHHLARVSTQSLRERVANDCLTASRPLVMNRGARPNRMMRSRLG